MTGTSVKALLNSALRAGMAARVRWKWLSHPNVELFAPGIRHWSIVRALLIDSGTAGNLSSDAHLAALAIEHEAERHSADADFQRYCGVRWVNPLVRTRESRFEESGEPALWKLVANGHKPHLSAL